MGATWLTAGDGGVMKFAPLDTVGIHLVPAAQGGESEGGIRGDLGVLEGQGWWLMRFENLSMPASMLRGSTALIGQVCLNYLHYKQSQ